MAAKSRKRKQSNFGLSDEPIRQPPSLVHNSMVHNQVSNSQHGESTQQNTCVLLNGNHEIQNGQSNNEQRGMANKTQNRKQSSFSLPYEPIQQPPSLIHSHMMDNQACNSRHEESTHQNTCDIINGSNEVENGQSSNNQKEKKKTRGPTYMLEIWGRPSILPRIKLDFDSFGRPIGANRANFVNS